MNRALAVMVLVVLAPSDSADAASCQDGATRVCRVNRRPGTQECVNGRWSRCLLDEPPPPPPSPPPPTPPPGSPVATPAHEVRVTSIPVHVNQPTAFTDCCILCGEQSLEAVTPTPSGPRAHLHAELPPARQTFCGTVTGYGVNDELADARDILFNLVPLPIAPFPDFVAGLVHTTGGGLAVEDLVRFGRTECDVDLCAARAPQIQGKTIHAEVTPDEHFYGQDALFLPIDGSGPCSDGWDCTSNLEPARGAEDVCVHGVYAIDHGDGHGATDHRRLCCFPDHGHDHPEIHPFDAIWWKDSRRNGWVFGVFQDDSNRYSEPHCSSDNNGAKWSQAPRDVTFRFPFRFKQAAGCQRVQLRHVRTTSLRTGAPNTVKPMNVTTSDLVGGAAEVLNYLAPGPRYRPLLEVHKEQNSDGETHVRVEGFVDGTDVAGDIVLRVAVGTDRRTAAPFGALRAANPLAIYDDGDPGAGYYYAELFFAGSCSQVIER